MKKQHKRTTQKPKTLRTFKAKRRQPISDPTERLIGDMDGVHKPAQPLRVPITSEIDPDQFFERREVAGKIRFYCTAGIGSAATATFLRHYFPLVASRISHARDFWKTRTTAGEKTTPEIILNEFPELGHLCTPHHVTLYIDPTGAMKHLLESEAAKEIFQEYFPDYTSIDRLSRARNRPKQ